MLTEKARLIPFRVQSGEAVILNPTTPVNSNAFVKTKSETKLTANSLKEDPNTGKIKNNANFNRTVCACFE